MKTVFFRSVRHKKSPEPAHRRSGGKKIRRIAAKLCAVCAFVMLINAVCLIKLGVWIPNAPDRQEYPLRGAAFDGSGGKISWGLLESGRIDFAYLRATSGISLADSAFAENWENAAYSAVKTGAVHDFDFSADGKQQALNFISAVGDSLSGRLVPAIDITMDIWERMTADPLEIIAVRLEEFVTALSEKYGCEPVLICSRGKALILANEYFPDLPIWAVSDLREPEFTDDWKYWQYSENGRCSYIEEPDGKCAMLASEDKQLDVL